MKRYLIILCLITGCADREVEIFYVNPAQDLDTAISGEHADDKLDGFEIYERKVVGDHAQNEILKALISLKIKGGGMPLCFWPRHGIRRGSVIDLICFKCHFARRYKNGRQIGSYCIDEGAERSVLDKLFKKNGLEPVADQLPGGIKK